MLLHAASLLPVLFNCLLQAIAFHTVTDGRWLRLTLLPPFAAACRYAATYFADCLSLVAARPLGFRGPVSLSITSISGAGLIGRVRWVWMCGLGQFEWSYLVSGCVGERMSVCVWGV